MTNELTDRDRAIIPLTDPPALSLIHPDPLTLRVRVGGTGDGKRYKTVAAIRGIPEVGEQYHKSLIVPFALSQIATFYTGESYKIKGVGWTVQKADFWIIAGNPMAGHQILGECQYVNGKIWGYHVAGYFDILAYGDGKTRALRLLKWWLEWEPTIPRRRAMAEHLGRMIGIRGQKDPGGFRIGECDIEIDDEPVFVPAQWDIEL